MKTIDTKTRIRISNPKHPHYNEIGHFTGKIITLLGKPMAEVALEHDSDGCFVSKGDVTIAEQQ